MCLIMLLVGVLAVLLGLLATGIVLVSSATTGVAIGAGLITFVVVIVIGFGIISKYPDLNL